MTVRNQVVSPFVERQPQAGDVYEFTRSCDTLGGRSYYPGDRILLLERTEEAPHGFWNPQGNWKCGIISKSPSANGLISIWSSIHDGIASGIFRLVAQATVDPASLPSRFDREEPI